MSENMVKAILAAVAAALGAYFRVLAVPVVVLVIMMALDYATGVAAAAVKKELSSHTGWVGILKKVLYMVVVVVGMCVDYVISMAGARIGMELEGCYWFGLLVVVWLILNECISILENAAELGIPIPKPLCDVLQKLKEHTEKSQERAGSLPADTEKN